MTKSAKKSHKRRPNDRPMAGALLRAWRVENGLAERDAALALGMSRGGLRNFESRGAPLYVAYACAAKMAGLEPYGINDREHGHLLVAALERKEYDKEEAE